MEEEVANHDLKRSRDVIQQKHDSALREHQRQKENLERESNQKIEKMNLDHIKAVEDHRREKVAMEAKLNEKIETLTAQIEDFTKKIGDMDVELSKIAAEHKTTMEEMVMTMNDNFEEKIKQIKAVSYTHLTLPTICSV